MATLRIDTNDSFTVDITVSETDKYTKSAYVRFDRHYIPEEIRGCNELFLTPIQLELLGKFFVRQAEEIKNLHSHREIS